MFLTLFLKAVCLKIVFDVFATSLLLVGGIKARLNDLLAKASIIQN